VDERDIPIGGPEPDTQVHRYKVAVFKRALKSNILSGNSFGFVPLPV